MNPWVLELSTEKTGYFCKELFQMMILARIGIDVLYRSVVNERVGHPIEYALQMEFSADSCRKRADS